MGCQCWNIGHFAMCRLQILLTSFEENSTISRVYNCSSISVCLFYFFFVLPKKLDFDFDKFSRFGKSFRIGRCVWPMLCMLPNTMSASRFAKEKKKTEIHDMLHPTQSRCEQVYSRWKINVWKLNRGREREKREDLSASHRRLSISWTLPWI